MGLVDSNVVLLPHQILENTKSVLEDRVLLLHGLGGKLCSIVTTSDFEVKNQCWEIGYCYYMFMVDIVTTCSE